MIYTATIAPSIGSISTGALLGTTGTAELVQSINDSLSTSSMFGGIADTFADIKNNFIQHVLRPIQIGRQALTQRVNALMNHDVIRALTDFDDFKNIPPCMYEPIIMFPPVRRLLEQGRINGFGYDPDHLPQEDVWGRLIDNGLCRDVLAAPVNEEGFITLNYEFCSDDPDVTFEQIDMVEHTRNTIERMLRETLLDPTDAADERG